MVREYVFDGYYLLPGTLTPFEHLGIIIISSFIRWPEPYNNREVHRASKFNYLINFVYEISIKVNKLKISNKNQI